MSALGTWQLAMNTPFGEQTPTVALTEVADGYAGTFDGAMGSGALEDVTIDGESFGFAGSLTTPMGTFNLTFEGTVDGDAMAGTVTTPLGGLPFTGVRT